MAADPAKLIRQPSRSGSVDSHASSAYTQPTIDSEESSELAQSWEPAVGVVDGSGDDVLLAVQALGLMRQGSDQGQPKQQLSKELNSALALDPSRSISSASQSSTSWSASRPTSSTAASSPSRDSSRFGRDANSAQLEGGVAGAVVEDDSDPKFIARVSALPIVSGGLEWYERSKASSRVVKYGAGLVESSLSTISRPLANNLQLGQLDEFACRQLDRLGGGAGGSPRNSPPPADSGDTNENDTIDLDEDPHASRERRGRAGADEHAEGSVPPTIDERKAEQQQAVAVASRSRWQTVLVEAGGLGAAVSEESLKSLRYCLQWLLYATAHLDHQIGVLRDFILSLQRHNSSSSGPDSDALVTASAAAHLGKIKHDVVDTIRKVVDVVSKYAGAALPEQAKRYVRQSILGLPMRWASAIETSRNGSVCGAQSGASTPVPERMNGHGEHPPRPDTPRASDPLKPTEDAAERVLTFAVESLDMLKGVTQTFSDSISSAEAWIERLRVVGLDRQRQRQAASAGAEPGSEQSLSTTSGIKRRRTPGRESDSGGEAEASTSALSGSAAGEGPDGGARRRKGPRSRDSTAASNAVDGAPTAMEVE